MSSTVQESTGIKDDTGGVKMVHYHWPYSPVTFCGSNVAAPVQDGREVDCVVCYDIAKSKGLKV